MNTTPETEFDYQTHMKESAQGPSEINRGTKAREKRREAAEARISQKDQLSRGLEKIQEIAEKSADGDYIYRGEPKHHEKVSSSLYRKYPESEAEYFDVEIVQKEMIEAAKGYTSETNDFEILTELQHYGGATNLIDFTTDYLIALFFACGGSEFLEKDGRVILLQKNKKINEWIKSPQNPRNRVIAQKSIFVRPPNGFIEPDHVINIPKELKNSMLDYLRKYHGISTKTIYNDLHGFIKTLQVLNLNPQMTMIRAYHNIGNTKSAQGDHKAALECYSRVIQVIQIYKDYPESLFNLMAFWKSESFFNRANAYMDLGQFKEAIKNYDEAICLKSKNALFNKGTALFNKGNALVALGYFNEALQCYSESAQEGMDSEGALENWRAVEKVIDIIGSRKYTVKTAPDCVLVWIAEYNGTEDIPFTGRVGNTGNFPYVVDSNGQGLSGGRGFCVRIRSENM